MAETDREKFQSIGASLELDRQSYLTHWQELSEFVSPRTSKFLLGEGQEGSKKHGKIVNETAMLALRVMRAGMSGGITSQVRPWFMLQTPDADLNNYTPVKLWLSDSAQRMRTVLQKSNFYNVVMMMYNDLGLYGTNAMAMLDDDQDVVRFYPFPIGSYSLGVSGRNAIDQLYRRYRLTARQMAQQFGYKNLSIRTKNLIDTKNWNTRVEVAHIILPNDNYDGSRLLPKYKAIRSAYWEVGENGDHFLRDSGFDVSPLLAPRWEVLGEEVYGSSPGMDALGSTKSLQLMERRAIEGIDKNLRPPMNAPSSMKNKRNSILPGDINYVDAQQGSQKFEPAYQIQSNTAEIENKARQIEGRINEAMYKDVFLMFSNMSGVQPRNMEEIARRYEEKLVMLGPALDRMNDEAFSPCIDRLFDIMQAQELLLPPPEELTRDGMDLKVEYTSVVAQAQKLSGATSMERFASFSGNLIAAFPQAADRVDVDGLIDSYAETIGVDPKVLVPLEQAMQARQQRAQQAQVQQQMDMAQQAASGAEVLSRADLNSDNALGRIAQSLTGG